MTEESLRAFDSLTLSQEDNRGWCVIRWGFLSDFVAIEMTVRTSVILRVRQHP